MKGEPKRRTVGHYRLGPNSIRLFTEKTSGGRFTDQTADLTTEVVIGLDYRYWHSVVEILLHELTELAMSDMGLRFVRCEDFTRGSDRYLFHADHSQFSEAIARVASVATEALPIIAKHFREVRR